MYCSHKLYMQIIQIKSYVLVLTCHIANIGGLNHRVRGTSV